MSDLDLLVEPARMADAVGLLVAAGLEEIPSEASHHRRLLCRPVEGAGPGIPVEVHRDLFDRPHPFRVNVDRLLAERTAVALPGGGTLPVLAPAAAWLHVAAHFSWSDAGAGPVDRTLEDLVRLGEATGLAPESLVREGRTWGVLEVIARVFHLVEEKRGPFRDPRLEAVLGEAVPFRPLATWVLRGRISRTLADPSRPEQRGLATLARSLLAPRRRDGAAILLAGLSRRLGLS